jgi:hypothetical protein
MFVYIICEFYNDMVFGVIVLKSVQVKAINILASIQYSVCVYISFYELIDFYISVCLSRVNKIV